MTINTKLVWEEISEWFDDDDGGGGGDDAAAGAFGKETGGQDENNAIGEFFFSKRATIFDQSHPLI